MNFIYTIIIISLLVCNIFSIEDNSLYKNSDNNTSNDDYYNEIESGCTLDNMIDLFIENALPEDYEESKELDYKRKINSFNETITIFTRFYQYSQNVSNNFERINKRIKARMFQFIVSVDMNHECKASLLRINQLAENGSQWARKYISSAINSDYDDCLEIKSTDDIPVIKGQYCHLKVPDILPSKDLFEDDPLSLHYLYQEINSFAPNQYMDRFRNKFPEYKNIKIRGNILDILRFNDYSRKRDFEIPAGVCIPTTCDAKDIEYVINKMLFPLTHFPISISDDCDYVDKEIKLNSYQLFTISILLLSIILIILSTSFEILNKRNIAHLNNKKLNDLATSFSLIKNANFLFTNKKSNERLESIDGLRALMSFWVVVIHEYYYTLNSLYIKNTEDSFAIFTDDKYVLLKPENFIDSFFLIGGMMTSYVWLRNLDKNKGIFDYLNYSFHRYFKNISVVAIGLFALFLMPLTGDGPNWKPLTKYYVGFCHNSWLYSILMISNYKTTFLDDMICNPVSWYVSADFQLFLLAPIVFLILFYSPKLGLIWNTFLIICGIFISIAPKVIFGIIHFYEMRSEQSWDKIVLGAEHLYAGIETHFSIYMIGILLGYLVSRKPNINFGGIVGESILWIISWFLTAFGYYWTKDFSNPSKPFTQTDLLLWIAFSKICHISGFFWLIYACCTGRAGIINRFLEWNGFKLMSKLSFEICILHMTVLFYRLARNREPVIFSDFYVWTVTIFDYLVTLLLSIIFHFLISGPSANLVKTLMDSNTKLTKDDNNKAVKDTKF